MVTVYQIDRLGGLQEKLRWTVPGPADLCIGQYRAVVRDIATCVIRDEVLMKPERAERQRAEHEHDEAAERVRDSLLREEKEREIKHKGEEKKMSKKKANQKMKKERRGRKRSVFVRRRKPRREEEDDRRQTKTAEEQEKKCDGKQKN